MYCHAADTTYRRAAVPANPVSWKWTYNWQCPEGMYITRFFGLASAYINTLNAQCARSWNLKEVGLAFASPTASNYSHTSLNGFEGIIIKGFSGGVDSIQLISARTKKLSAIFGAPNAFGPASTLQCEPGTVIVGIHGRQDAFVSSIGITCGSGKPVGMGNFSKRGQALLLVACSPNGMRCATSQICLAHCPAIS